MAPLGRKEVHTGFWWVNLKKETEHLEELGVDGR